jgi:hypothetical protein
MKTGEIGSWVNGVTQEVLHSRTRNTVFAPLIGNGAGRIFMREGDFQPARPGLE